MSALPHELARWESELASFPGDLAIALGAWMGRLHAAIGPWAQANDREGEPDGLGELSRRGPYDRLLASEWLLAGEMPDEFLRRAANREHLFLSRIHTPRRARRHAIALFDAGPSQLGAPRIAHLALLLVLHRRARAADARFSWGVLQRPDAPLSQEVDPAALRVLLEARTTSEPAEAHFDAWKDALGDADLWLVGGRRAAIGASLARGVVSVEDPLAIDRASIDVEIRQQGRRAAIELTLPDDATCTRLIRDPFHVAHAAPVTIGATSGRLALPSDGRRIVIESAHGFASWAIPASKNGSSGAPRKLVIDPGETLLAVGHRGRKIFAVGIRTTEEGREYVLHRSPFAAHDVTVPLDDARVATTTHGLGNAVVHVLSMDSADLDLTFHDGHRRLVSVRASTRQTPAVWNDVIGMTAVHDGALIVVSDGADASTRVERVRRDGAVHLVFGREVSTAHAVFGSHNEVHAVVGFALDPDRKTYVLSPSQRGGSVVELSPPSETRVIGALHDSAAGASLVIVDESERSISVIARNHARCALRASGRITEAHAAHRGGIVAWRTAEGWVEVGSLVRNEILLRIPPSEETDA